MTSYTSLWKTDDYITKIHAVRCALRNWLNEVYVNYAERCKKIYIKIWISDTLRSNKQNASRDMRLVSWVGKSVLDSGVLCFICWLKWHLPLHPCWLSFWTQKFLAITAWFITKSLMIINVLILCENNMNTKTYAVILWTIEVIGQIYTSYLRFMMGCINK